MTFDRSNIGFFIAFVLIGAVLGQALGNLVVTFFPGAEIITNNLTEAVALDLSVIALKIRLSISSIIGLLSGILIFIKI